MHHNEVSSCFRTGTLVDLFRNSDEAGWRGCFRLEKKKSVICGDIYRPRSHELLRTWTGIEDNLYLVNGKSCQNLPFRFTSRFLSIIWSLVIFRKNVHRSIFQSWSTFQNTWPTETQGVSIERKYPHLSIRASMNPLSKLRPYHPQGVIAFHKLFWTNCAVSVEVQFSKRRF